MFLEGGCLRKRRFALPSHAKLWTQQKLKSAHHVPPSSTAHLSTLPSMTTFSCKVSSQSICRYIRVFGWQERGVRTRSSWLSWGSPCPVLPGMSGYWSLTHAPMSLLALLTISRHRVLLIFLSYLWGKWNFLPIKGRDCAFFLTVTSEAGRLLPTHEVACKCTHNHDAVLFNALNERASSTCNQTGDAAA